MPASLVAVICQVMVPVALMLKKNDLRGTRKSRMITKS
jgi:hypothetical protein